MTRQGDVWWANLPEPTASEAGERLPKDSVANVSLVLAVNRQQLAECVGQISERELQQIFIGIDIVLGRA